MMTPAHDHSKRSVVSYIQIIIGAVILFGFQYLYHRVSIGGDVLFWISFPIAGVIGGLRTINPFAYGTMSTLLGLSSFGAFEAYVFGNKNAIPADEREAFILFCFFVFLSVVSGIVALSVNFVVDVLIESRTSSQPDDNETM